MVARASGPATPLRVLVAPDSFKGTLTSVEVARALATGWGRGRPGDAVTLAPLADGGEGTLVAVETAGGWTAEAATVHDPLGRPVRARWLRSADGARAFAEMASASGLSLVAPADRDARRATSVGTGELLRAILDAGVRHIALGIGGSATTDGGAGLLRALGADIDDALASVSLTGLDPRLAETELRIACDVTNPLLGGNGAAAVYGPQKGATAGDVAALDGRLARFADALAAASGRDERLTPGAGAAGGVGFGLLSIAGRFRALTLEPGVDLVMAETGFDDALAAADLVLTGEGRIDAQTAFGKTALGVARRARAAGVACIGFGGGVTPEGIEALAAVGAIAIPVAEAPMSLEAALAAGPGPLERAAERTARLVTVGAPAAPAAPAGSPRGGSDMDHDEAKRMLADIAAAFDAHDLDRIMGHFAADAVFEGPRGTERWGTRFTGHEAIRAAFAARFAGIPDVRYREDDHFVDGDRGASEWTLSGTTTAGERIEVRGCDLWTLRDGKVVKKDSYWKIRPGT